MTYADIISDICKHRFTNLTRLERDCGFSQGTIRRWDKINPGIDKLIKVLAERMGMLDIPRAEAEDTAE